MKILLIAVGTTGDVYPFLGLGKWLRDAGHEIVFIVNEHFRPEVERESWKMWPIGTAELYRDTLKQYGYQSRGLGSVLKLRSALEPLLPFVVDELYDAIAANHEPGQTVIGMNAPCFGAAVAQEHLKIPVVRVRVQALGTSQSSIAARWGIRTTLNYLVWMALKLTGIEDRVQNLRRRLGLPMRRLSLAQFLTDDVTPRIALHPRWFVPREASIPHHTTCCGFPLYDASGGAALADDVETFLVAGSPPIAFATASWVGGDCSQFYEASLAASRALSRRALLLRPQGQEISTAPTDDWHGCGYVPYSKLLPRVAALVHHGGLGTVAQALAAGVPQLVTPLSSDQPFNAKQLQRLEVGESIKPAAYTTATATAAIHRLLSSPQIKERCRDFARHVAATQHADAAVRTFESAWESVADPRQRRQRINTSPQG